MAEAPHHEGEWLLTASIRSACPQHRTVQLRSDILPIRETASLLRPYSHNVEELSQKFAEWIRQLPDRWDDRTKRHHHITLGRLQSIETSMNGRAWIEITVLSDYMYDFDKLFFQGALRPFTKLSIEENILQSNIGIKAGLAYFIEGMTWADIDRRLPFFGIRIWNLANSSCWKDASPEKRRGSILRTLLHEMVHALIQIYRCQGKACITSQRMNETDGKSGHGPSWVAVMRAVQHTVSKSEYLEELLDSAALGISIDDHEE